MKLIFIDYENVQPKTLTQLSPNEHFVALCIGENQKLLPVSLIKSLIMFGKNCRIIECPKAGKNALDFIIVDEMARITTEYQFNALCIISRDKGFDSIIHYYLTKGRIQQAKRLDSIDDIPTSGNDNAQTTNMSILALKVQKQISKINQVSPRSLPNKPKSQFNWINSLLKDQSLSTENIKTLIKMVDFSSSPPSSLKVYIDKAKKKLNSLEKNITLIN